MAKGEIAMNRFPIVQAAVVALLTCGSLTALAQSQAQAPKQQASKQTAPKQAAPAKAESTGPNARSLGHADALLDYCTKAEPSSVAKLQARIKQYSQGASDAELAKMRETDEYRQANGAERDLLARIQPRKARSTCARAPAAIK
jgi:hypothetical protein